MDILDKSVIKVAICGKANSGKNTTSTIIAKELASINDNIWYWEIMAFATPIKNMILEMFPQADRGCLFGSSELRNQIIPNAVDKEGRSLTYRQACIDIGTLGRQYNKNIWVNAFDEKVKQMNIHDLIICNDLRFINEYNYLKSKRFFIIKLIRDTVAKSSDATETEQDGIKLEQFDYILNNNGTQQELQTNIVKNILPLLQKHN